MNAILPSSFKEFAEARGHDVGEELIIDGFAGGGGASEGIEEAFRRMKLFGMIGEDHPGTVSIAINHDAKAIAMHRANHPDTMHLTSDIWTVDPVSVTGGLPVGAMWASPDCRDHSKAKGGRPVSASVRDLANVVVHFAEQVRPRIIFLENVEEFKEWGPLMPDGKGGMKRDPKRKGTSFNRWVGRFRKLGYKVEWRELRASEFGVPTIRKRLFIVMRCDGEPIVWPETTHGPLKSDDVKSGKLWPNEIAADIIDWSLPCPSILMSKADAKAYKIATGTTIIRPLQDNTERRIAKGVKRYVLDAAAEDRFIVTCNHAGDEFRGQGLDVPLNTVAAARDATGLIVPHLQAYYGASAAGGNDRSAGVDEPIRVITTEPRHALIAPCMVGVGGRIGQSPPRPITAPYHTITTKADGAIVAPYLVPRYGERLGQAPRTRSMLDLYPTVVPTGNGGGLAAAELAPFITHGQHGGRSRAADAPIHTVEASVKDTNQIAAVFLSKHTTGGIGSSMLAGLPTVTANSFIKRPGGASPLGMTAVYLVRQFGNSVGSPATEPVGTVMAGGGGKTQLAATFLAQNNTGLTGAPMRKPVSTIVGKGSTQSLVAALLSHSYTSNTAGGQGSPMKPLKTIMAGGNHANVVQMPMINAYYGVDQNTPIQDPLHTVSTNDRFSFLEASAAPPPLTDEQLDKARKVAAFLRKYDCWDDREFVTVGDYIIVDIGMRMLTPRELARAQGFPEDYILAAPLGGGKTLTETDQRHKIGNSVCPEMATLIFMANYRPQKRVAPVPDQGWLFKQAA